MHQPREARSVPIERREAEGPLVAQAPARRAAGQIEIRQRDLDLDMGGIGWIEDCPACE